MEKNKTKKKPKKLPLPERYEKPTLSSEDLMAFAASCNGTTNGGRKASVGGPNFCNSRRLNS